MIRLELVEYHMQKLQVKRIIEKHHSYVPSNRSVGRRIDWLIYHSEHTNNFGIEEPVGMEFYGMASQTARDRHGHPNREYRGEEGKTVTVPYRGPVEYTANDILGGIRSACTYVGAKRLKDLTKCTTFVRVNNTHNKIYE